MKTGKNSTVKLRLLGFLFLIIFFGFLSSASATFTGSIGNARMILKVEQGDEIEKYILVKNVNEVNADIELFATGDLADYTKIREDKFSLQAGEDKKAYFTIKAEKAGTTETRINVKFTPSDGGNGVGLSSTVIVITEKKEGNWFSDLFKNSDSSSNSDDSGDSGDSGDSDVRVSVGGDSSGDNSGITGNVLNERKSSPGLMKVAVVLTFILLIAFVFLLVVAVKIRNHVNGRGERNKPKKSAAKT